MSQRFYCPDPPREGCYRLPTEEARHLLRVCRHRPGDCIEIFDGKGFATLARIVAASDERVSLVAEGVPIPDPRPACSVTLATAIPKGDRFDWLVEKATELGVDRIIPILTERSVVDPRGSKLDRLRRTIIEASKQSRRNRLMVLDSPRSWAEVVEIEEGEVVRMLADRHGLPPPRWPGVAGKRVLLAVGPEGGFTPAEEDQANEAGWIPVQLGVNVLRIETAAVAGAALIMALCPEYPRDEPN